MKVLLKEANLKPILVGWAKKIRYQESYSLCILVELIVVAIVIQFGCAIL